MSLREMVVVAKFAAKNPALVMDLLNAGRLDSDVWPLIVKGGQTYVEAIAAGDVTERDVQMLRAAECGTCPNYRRATSPGGLSGREFAWCGMPLVELADGEPAAGRAEASLGQWSGVDWEGVVGPACGCCLELMWMVASKACPRGRWGKARRAASVRLTVGASG